MHPWLVAREAHLSTARKLLFSLLSVALFLGGAEFVLRGLGWPKVEPGAQFAHSAIYWKTDPNLRDEPMLHRELGVSFPVSSDENGLRAPVHPVQKPAGRFRVMTMGCSTTFGWGVKDDETYPAVLERLLHERGYSGVEVVNAGQPGYTSFQGRWLWENTLAQYQPDLVLLGFVVQDARTAAFSDLSQAILTREAAFLKSNVLYSWRLYLALKVLTGEVTVRTKEREAGASDGTWRVSEREYLDNLRALRAQIQAQGGQVMHFGFPLEVVGYTEQHRRLLRLEAEAANIPHFDPSDAVAQAARERTLYFPQDRGHPNADGTALIGQLVADFLVDNGLVEGR